MNIHPARQHAASTLSRAMTITNLKVQASPHPGVAAHLRHLTPARERQDGPAKLGRGELQRGINRVGASPHLEGARECLKRFAKGTVARDRTTLIRGSTLLYTIRQNRYGKRERCSIESSAAPNDSPALWDHSTSLGKKNIQREKNRLLSSHASQMETTRGTGNISRSIPYTLYVGAPSLRTTSCYIYIAQREAPLPPLPYTSKYVHMEAIDD